MNIEDTPTTIFLVPFLFFLPILALGIWLKNSILIGVAAPFLLVLIVGRMRKAP